MREGSLADEETENICKEEAATNKAAWGLLYGPACCQF